MQVRDNPGSAASRSSAVEQDPPRQPAPSGIAIRATVRKPLAPAAVSLASMVLASGASAQDSALPQIDVVGAESTYQTINPGLTRVPTPILNTPQSIAVVPDKVIQEQNTSNVKDALRNVAGITFRAGEGGNQGDTPYIRGFTAQNDIFRDGIRDPGWYTRDSFPIDAIEVYKGPSSVLFGRGSTGGAINLITKTPQERNFIEATLSGNTGPGVRSTVDVNRQVADNVWARIIVMGQLYDIAGRDHVEENRWGVAPSLKVKLNQRTTATFSYIYQHDNNIPDYGVPFLTTAWGNPRPIAPVARGTWYGILSGPYPDVERVDAHILTAKIEHDINNQVKITNTTRYSNVSRFQRNVFPEPNASVPAPPNLNANWTPNRAQVDVTNTMLANNTDILAKFSTGFMQHTMTTGFEINRETRDFLRNNFTGMGATNFLDPNPYRAGGTPQAPTASQLTSGEALDLAAYIADQVKLNEYFELLGSARIERYNFKQNAPLAAASVQNLERTDNVFSWRAGAVFHPLPNTSLYAMYGTSFNPSADNMSISVSNTNTALSQIAIGPEKNETTEVGAKAEVLNGKLTLAAALFWTEKTNMRVPDPANTSVTVLAGVVRANGFEASATGKITDLWSVIASYTYVHARIVQTTNAYQLGNEPLNTPTHAFSLWTTYDVTPQLQVGAGAFYTSEVYGDLASATVPQSALVPDWWRFDAMVAYKVTPNATVQLNVYNLFDKLYYTSAYTNWAVPGASRTAMLTLRVRY